jgi:hypothetical protein
VSSEAQQQPASGKAALLCTIRYQLLRERPSNFGELITGGICSWESVASVEKRAQERRRAWSDEETSGARPPRGRRLHGSDGIRKKKIRSGLHRVWTNLARGPGMRLQASKPPCVFSVAALGSICKT